MPNGFYSSDHPAVLSHVAWSRVSPPVKCEEPGTRLGVRHLADLIGGTWRWVSLEECSRSGVGRDQTFKASLSSLPPPRV